MTAFRVVNRYSGEWIQWDHLKDRSTAASFRFLLNKPMTPNERATFADMLNTGVSESIGEGGQKLYLIINETESEGGEL